MKTREENKILQHSSKYKHCNHPTPLNSVKVAVFGTEFLNWLIGFWRPGHKVYNFVSSLGYVLLFYLTWLVQNLCCKLQLLHAFNLSACLFSLFETSIHFHAQKLNLKPVVKGKTKPCHPLDHGSTIKRPGSRQIFRILLLGDSQFRDIQPILFSRYLNQTLN